MYSVQTFTSDSFSKHMLSCLSMIPVVWVVFLRIYSITKLQIWGLGLHYFFFFQPLPYGCGVATADTILLQAILSWTSSFVVPMAMMSRLTQSIHLCFGLPRLLLTDSTISRVCLPTYSWSRLLTCPNHLNLAFLLLTVMFSTVSLSQIPPFRTWSLSMWPHAHQYIFISVTSSLFPWELVTGTVSIMYSIAG